MYLFQILFAKGYDELISELINRYAEEGTRGGRAGER